jgi:putative transposase
MKQFKSASQAQRFLSAHDQINNLFHSAAITSLAPSTELARMQALWVWAEINSLAVTI